MIRLPNLLLAEDLARIREITDSAGFVDGMQTGRGYVESIKRNNEVRMGSEGQDALDRLVRGRLEASNDFRLIAMPKRIGNIIFSAYTEGMHFGDHSDNALMGTADPFRSDLAMTVFLNNPPDYEGGELVLDTDMQPIPIKLPAGDAVIYPTFSLHRVNPVRRGERRVAVTWIQSTIRLPQHRQILLDLARSLDFFIRNTKEGIQHPEAIRLDKVYKNLTRLWAEP